jgi:endoglucanase
LVALPSSGTTPRTDCAPSKANVVTLCVVTYANQLNGYLAAAKPFVIDTSRNGNGSNGEWCNPAGRKLGTTAQVGGGAEMLLWVKVPGDSDGVCGVSSYEAGQFDPDLAIELING